MEPMEQKALIHPGLMEFWVYYISVRGRHYQGLANVLKEYRKHPLSFFTLVPEEVDLLRGYLLVEGIDASVTLLGSIEEVPSGDFLGYRIFTFNRNEYFRETIDSLLPNISL